MCRLQSHSGTRQERKKAEGEGNSLLLNPDPGYCQFLYDAELCGEDGKVIGENYDIFLLKGSIDGT